MVYFNHSQKKFLDPLKVVGIDVNKAMMACSDGRQFENQQFNSKYGVPELKAKIEKVEKGSKEEKALKAELRKTLKAAKEERETFFKKLIPKMINLATDAVCIEKLDIPQMYEVADEKLKEDLQDLGLSIFYKELISFCKQNNIPVAQIDVHIPSSKLCSFCGFKYEELKAQKYWICPHCDTKHQRDYNAALNIKEAGIKELKKRGFKFMKVTFCTISKPEGGFSNCDFAVSASDGLVLAFSEKLQKEALKRLEAEYSKPNLKEHHYFGRKNKIQLQRLIGFDTSKGFVTVEGTCVPELRWLLLELGFQMQIFIQEGQTPSPNIYFLESLR